MHGACVVVENGAYIPGGQVRDRRDLSSVFALRRVVARRTRVVDAELLLLLVASTLTRVVILGLGPVVVLWVVATMIVVVAANLVAVETRLCRDMSRIVLVGEYLSLLGGSE